MITLRFFFRAVACWAACVALGPSMTRAEFLTSLSVETTPWGGDRTLYTYTLENSNASTLNAVQFALEVSPTADLDHLSGPVGWLITYEPGDETIDFLSLAEETDLQPGSTARFSFSSPLGPSLSDYLIVGLDLPSVSVEINQGQVAGPGATAIPEPSTLTLLGSGVLSLLGYSCCRTKKSPKQ
ncbi:PEP-CTERM sorting domain-containing protein [Tautonia sp. JC769]|uniref:PEP-CTERM sorting domain-containing protein n=1 Tax=Tautonia sp. JC769 TaxID=3232135 RepID=UPI003458FD0C